MYGWCGRQVTVDLSDGSFSSESVPVDSNDSLIGGIGVGAHALYVRTEGRIDPLSPENPLIFSTGPLTGTGIGTSGRFCVTCISPLTSLYLQSHSGGHLGPELKYAGIDHLYIEGKSDKPCYIYIDDGHVEVRSAAHVWGKGVKAATRMLEDETDPEARVASIGPAGESLCLMATIQNDVYRSCGRGGAGAVMGSKNLKAVVVRGTGAVDVFDPDTIASYLRQVGDTAKSRAAPFSEYGTANAGILTSAAGVLPTRNFTSGTFGRIRDIAGEAMKDTVWKSRRSCFSCPIGCSQYSVNGGVRTEGPEYETTFSLGSNLLNGDMNALVAANERANDLGIDTISAGVTLSWYEEACEKGLFDRDPRWGDGGHIIDMLQKMAYRKDEGDLLADGVRRASERMGGSDYAIHVKGMELPGYDPRTCQGMAISYATSSRGACHLRAPIYVNEIFTKKLSARTLESKAAHVVELENILVVMDCLIVCRFGSRTLMQQDFGGAASLLRLVTGKEYGETELEDIAQRIVAMQRLINIRQGLTSSDDTLPERFFTQSLDGQQLDRNEFREAIGDYYSLRGWDGAGVPGKDLQKRLHIV